MLDHEIEAALLRRPHAEANATLGTRCAKRKPTRCVIHWGRGLCECERVDRVPLRVEKAPPHDPSADNGSGAAARLTQGRLCSCRTPNARTCALRRLAGESGSSLPPH